MQLQQALDRAGMTQAQLSRATGLSPSQISDFVRGRKAPALATLVKLADGLGCTTDALIGREDNP